MTDHPAPLIQIAETDEQIARCFACLRELRPHLRDEANLVARVRRQQALAGYRLVFIEDGALGEVVCVAGYRISEFLAWGKTLYLDDLATATHARRRGHAGRMLDWLTEAARAEGCDSFHLDSGVQRHEAHRLYLAKRFAITSHHFARDA